MNNIEKIRKEKCTGCELCVNICPVDAISMKQDEEGFLQPYVDVDKCIDCGMCANNCAQIKGKIEYNSVKKAYAVVCLDEIREKCSSGGVFGAVGKWCIEHGGIVFGAAFNNDFKSLHHIGVSNEKDLQKLFKSKYFQSEIGNAFIEVKKNLLQNKQVVFCGCPCQVHALKQFLKVDYENLLTIDILCHGVVSPMAYRLFIKEFFGDVESPITDVDFRSKKLGWACNVVNVKSQDGTERISPYNGSYFDAFLWGYSQRKACFECQFSRSDRVGDITIGDFWGIDEICTQINDKKGVSLLLCNTEKGQRILKKIENCITKIEDCDYSEVLKVADKVNWALTKPGIMPKNRDTFFYRLRRGDKFSQALKYASTASFDVGIFGWWFEDDYTNYGSTLTYYALMEYISSLGLSVCMITSPYHNEGSASKFVKEHGYRITKTYDFNNFKEHNKNIDTFLIGSDQLWFYNCYKSWGHSLFLDFVDDDKRKISYATSFGHKNPHIPDSEIPILKKYLKRFDAISTREIDGVEILNNTFDVDSTQVLDSVFLCEDKHWNDIANDAVRKTDGQYIFSYMLDPTDDKIKALLYLSDYFSMKIVSITDKQYMRNEKENMLRDYGIIKNASIYELIYHLKNATYIVTDSYHGTCFSLIFRKSFVSIINPKRGISRFDTLEKLFHVGNRFVNEAYEIQNRAELLKKPNYAEISPLIERATQKSKAWLNDMLLNKYSNKNKDQINDINIQNHVNIIKDFRILTHMGYSVGRYLYDSGINCISVYCDEKYLDIFEEFLISLQFDDCIRVEGYYSNKQFAFKHKQSLNYGMAYFKKEKPIKGVVIHVSDVVDTMILPGCQVYSLLKLQWKALAYASEYRPLVQFKNIHPNVNMLVVKSAIFPPKEKRDERENIMAINIEDYSYDKLLKKIPDSFSVFDEKNYKEKDWQNVFRFAKSEVDTEGKKHYVDYKSKLVNVKNGHRITVGQPESSDKTIYCVGGCRTFGYGSADDETISSCLQKKINQENKCYSVENWGAFISYNNKEKYQILNDLPVKDGDIVVFEAWGNIPDICKNYFDFLDLHELFFRPHNYGHVFVDALHPSYIGQKVIAEKIFEHLQTKKFYKESSEEVTNKLEVVPGKVWGVP